MSTVVLDVTAGAGEGSEALEAAALASLELDLDLVLVGDQTDITESLAGLAHDAERLQVLHAPDRLDTKMPAKAAIQWARRSAVAVGLQRVADTPKAAFVTAGHAGVVVIEAGQRLEHISGIRRAALAAVYPTLRHRGQRNDPFALLLDVGATLSATAEELVHFAVMGAAYARQISANETPRVALLSNSSRSSTGPPPVRQADRTLRSLRVGFEYVGCLRADHLTLGDADVVVSDGFTGDVVLRTLEGVAATAGELIRRADERFSWRLGVSMLGGGIERLRELTDWENYGGAPLLGFSRPVILTQSNSHRRAFFNAIRLAAKMERTQVVTEVTAALERIATRPADHDE